MFQSARKPRTRLGSALNMAEVIFHSVVHDVRKAHNNAFMAIGVNLLQIGMFVLGFYVMFTVLGTRRFAIRGDFLMYLLSGIFLYMSHIRTLGAVSGAGGATSPMMLHAPMNTIIAICSAAFGVLYVQVLSLLILLFLYYIAVTPFVIDDAASAFGMLLLAWFTGGALGLVLLAVKPWAPGVVSIFSTVYQRANMIASGKMFVANSLPGFMLAIFDWNPLFHIIDQSRGYVFINYNPRYTTWEYALTVGLVLLMVGLMGEFYTRRHASLSWTAKQ